MLKVSNRTVTAKIASTTYKANGKRNLLTIFALFLTTFLISVIIALGVGYWTTIAQRQIRMEGMDYDVELTEPAEKQVQIIREMDEVKYAGVAVKCAIVNTYEDKKLDKMRLYWLDDICWEHQTIPALEEYTGHYPEKENEIMLSGTALRSMGITRPKEGMRISVTYDTLAQENAQADSAGEEEASASTENTGKDSTQADTMHAGEEGIRKEFVLCGWYTDYSGNNRGYVSEAFFRETGVKQTDLTQGSLKISLKNPLYTEKDIIRMQNAVGLERMQIIEGDYDTISSFLKMSAVLLVLLAMIFASGCLFIYNTLYISITKDIRYYGQLKTIGMTSRQLKGIVYRQALWNSCIGIPAGLAVSAVVSRLAVPGILHMVNPTVSAGQVTMVSGWSFVLAGTFALLVNLLSSRKPANLAGEVAPVEAMRYVAGMYGKKKGKKNKKKKMQNSRRQAAGDHKKKKRRTAGGQSVVWQMARQNMFRDKKQAAVIFLSFIIALSIFVTVNALVRGNEAERILEKTMDYDIEFKNETTLDEDERQLITEEKIQKLKNIPGVKEVRKVTSTPAVVPYQEETYGEYLKEIYETRYSPGNYEEDMEQYKSDPSWYKFQSRLIGVDEEGFALLNEKLGNVLDEEAFLKGEIAVSPNFFLEGDAGMKDKTVHFSLPEGLHPEKEETVRIAAVGEANVNPAYFAGGYIPELIVSEEYAKKLMGETFTELVDVVYEEPFSEETEKAVKAVFAGESAVSTYSRLDRYHEMKTSENQVKVLGGGLGGILAVLAVMNYLNVMAASVQARRDELATLESIGMTVKQTKKMLRIEGAGYALLSIAGAVIFGLPLSFLAFQAMNVYFISFSIPWFGNLILFGCALLVCVTAPVIIYDRTQNASVIERLRDKKCL